MYHSFNLDKWVCNLLRIACILTQGRVQDSFKTGKIDVSTIGVIK
tara:strand:+ start:609 stop:743 length:135 start_codon:yes stop_codon:yes gene_type:complete